MPSVPLHLVVDHHAFSSHYVWYSHCHLLRRQSLETHVDEPVMAFPGDIQRLEANDFLCVVATKNNMFSFTLWASTSPDYVAERVRRWILTPNRLVYETVDGIYEWDFTNTCRLASGTLIGASDTRILRESGKTASRHRPYATSGPTTASTSRGGECRSFGSSRTGCMGRGRRVAWNDL